MTKKYIVFTSEYASAARYIAKELEKKLGIKFYGEEDLLIRTAKESGIDEKVLSEYDEKLANSKFDETLQLNELDLGLKIYNAYSDTILKIVEVRKVIVFLWKEVQI
ncbi:cytidylate kinase family protein [Clostridium estertheticum]|uniref:Uncharacterized protein n=1 Tax=Clostridium estertheticum subsp. estertheticum TaxID=1552 RepID=A0A1J0GJ60_9CLOT|nr:cytidylate kinase family protein [Clostridium estertheticum]APC41369.1 hypothetical protein A7L45_15420 [Clostridium estertheticum subsp. estertheticum]